MDYDTATFHIRRMREELTHRLSETNLGRSKSCALRERIAALDVAVIAIGLTEKPQKETTSG